MRKHEIVRKVAKELGAEPATVKSVVEEFMKTIKDKVSDGEDIAINGFGRFYRKLRKEKVAQNIAEGKQIIIPEHYVPAIDFSKEFKNSVKNGD